MGHSDLDPAIHDRRPWNAGKNVGAKRPLKPRDIWAIRFYLDEHKRIRDRALFDLKSIAHSQRLTYLAQRRARADTFKALHIS